jgi:succinate dehydrogenase/fumarate reductase-like Fe-S protein/nitrate reductase gamma subunit
MDFFDIGLTLALIICTIGVVWRVSRWFWKRGGEAITPPFESPALSWYLLAVRGVWIFFLDVVLLARTGRTSRLRWLAHCLVFYGFMGLLLLHAMDETITANVFPAYEPTLDPWQFLRNLFGVMTLVGLALMTWRRVTLHKLRAMTRFQDWAAILIVAAIIVSGFFLEASKIISPAVFDRMVYEYLVPEDGSDVTALKVYWADEYGLVVSERIPTNQAVFEKGALLNEESCVDCHSDTSSAFVSRPLSKAFGPLTSALNTSRADEAFWYFHVIFCFIALAAFPFGKFFHPFSTPVNMVSRLGRHDGAAVSQPAELPRGLGMDACTRCGECSLHCSVAPSFSVLGNSNILPSEKLVSLRQFQTEKSLSGHPLDAFAEGSRICTECLRCTDICPSGINLHDLWTSSRTRLSEQVLDPNDVIRQKTASHWSRFFDEADGGSAILPPVAGLADNSQSYWACVQCTTCTSVCPVVAVSEDPSRDLDLTPQQIMNLLRMGLKDQTLGARMVWSCTTCYKCQEHCPQNIRVADVLYELRNTVAARLRDTKKTNCGNGETK